VLLILTESGGVAPQGLRFSAKFDEPHFSDRAITILEIDDPVPLVRPPRNMTIYLLTALLGIVAGFLVIDGSFHPIRTPRAPR
jgi:hypothetical protein